MLAALLLGSHIQETPESLLPTASNMKQPFVSQEMDPNDPTKFSIDIKGRVFTVSFGDSPFSISQDSSKQDFKRVTRARDGFKFSLEFGLLPYAEKLDEALKSKMIKTGSQELQLMRSIDSLMAACRMDPEFYALFKETENIQVVFYQTEADLNRYFGGDKWKTLGVKSGEPCFSLNSINPDEKIKTAFFIQDEHFRSAPWTIFLPFIVDAAIALELEKYLPSELTPEIHKEALEKGLKPLENVYKKFKDADPLVLEVEGINLETLRFQIDTFKKRIAGDFIR